MAITLSGDTGLAGDATGALNGTLGATTPSTVAATTITATTVNAALNGTLGATTPAAATATTVVANTSITSSGNMQINGAGLIGYATGSGGAVTQATSKSTGVTLNKPCGVITMNNAALANGATVYFTMSNSYINAYSAVLLTFNGAPIPSGSYDYWVDYVDGTNCRIAVKNISGASRSDALIINFAIINVVNS